MRRTLVPVALMAFALAIAVPHVHAQQPYGAGGHVSQSTMSGERSEPAANEKEDPAEALKKPSPVVAKIGHAVGLSPDTSVLAFQWFNFLILAIAVISFCAKALPKFFRGRTEKIQKNIVEARVATEEARLRLAAVEARLGKLDGEIAALRADSEAAATAEESRTAAQVEEEKRRIVQAAEQEIAAASSAAQRSLRAYAAQIAVDRAASQLQISQDDDRVLIENFAGKLQADRSRN